MNYQTQQRLLIFSLAALIVLGLYAFLLWDIMGHADQAVELAQFLREERARSETMVSAKHLIADTASARAELDQYFIGAEGVVDFIERIERMAKEAGVEVVFTTVDAPREDKTPRSLERLLLRFSATGPWGQVVRFFTLVESLPYAASVTGARMERQSPLEWRAFITLTAYKHI